MGRDGIKYSPNIREGTKNTKADCIDDPRNARNFLIKLVVQVFTNHNSLLASVNSIELPNENQPKCRLNSMLHIMQLRKTNAIIFYET